MSLIAAAAVVSLVFIIPGIPGVMQQTTEEKLAAIDRPNIPSTSTGLLEQEWYGKYNGSMVTYINPKQYFGGFDYFGENSMVEAIFLPVSQQILDDSVFADLGLKVGTALIFDSSTYGISNGKFPTSGTVMVCVETSTMKYVAVVDKVDFDESLAAQTLTIIRV